MRVLCDTNILVRAVISPFGAAAELLALVARDHTLIVSFPLLGELYDVLRRPHIRRLHRLDDARVRRVISRLSQLAVVVPLPSAITPTVPNDPKDDPIVMTALIGKAEVLCTLDRHLHAPAVATFCAAQGVRVLRDTELLPELRGP